MKPAKNCQSCTQIITSRSLMLRKGEIAGMLWRVEKKREIERQKLKNKKTEKLKNTKKSSVCVNESERLMSFV